MTFLVALALALATVVFFVAHVWRHKKEKNNALWKLSTVETFDARQGSTLRDATASSSRIFVLNRELCLRARLINSTGKEFQTVAELKSPFVRVLYSKTRHEILVIDQNHCMVLTADPPFEKTREFSIQTFWIGVPMIYVHGKLLVRIMNRANQSTCQLFDLDNGDILCTRTFYFRINRALLNSDLLVVSTNENSIVYLDTKTLEITRTERMGDPMAQSAIYRAVINGKVIGYSKDQLLSSTRGSLQALCPFPFDLTCSDWQHVDRNLFLLTSKWESRLVRFTSRQGTALICGLHHRCGRKSVLSRLSRSLFEKQVIRQVLLFADAHCGGLAPPTPPPHTPSLPPIAQRLRPNPDSLN